MNNNHIRVKRVDTLKNSLGISEMITWLLEWGIVSSYT